MSNPAIPYELRRPARPPRPTRIPRIRWIHGEKWIDDYAWLSDRDNPEVLAHLEAEDAWAEAAMQPTERLQEALYAEMLGRIRETDVNVPWRMGDWEYFTRTEEGKQYSIISRRRGEGEPEQVILDLNELARGRDYIALGDLDVSDDGNLLAYSIDASGAREYTLFIKDLRTGSHLPDRIEHVTSIAWGADSATLFFAVEDETKRPFRLMRHRVGEPGHELLYEEEDALFRLWVTRSRSREYLFATSASATTSEVRYLRATDCGESFRLIEPRDDGHEYYVDHRGEELWIVTNDTGKNFRLAIAPLADPRRDAWREVLPHRDEVKLEDIEIFESFLVIFERERGLDHLLVLDLVRGERHRIAFSEPVYSVSAGSNRVFESTSFRLFYESFVTPLTVYDYDIRTRQMIPLKRTEVLGGYDPAQYVSERIEAIATDGTRVPISLVRRRDAAPGGKHPLILYGYGAYGHPVAATFSSSRLSLLDRGVIWATAHVRGGGEMGEAWHEQGRMGEKRNTFADYIACTEALIAGGYTAPDRLVAMGSSAGGLLVGAALNMRPELFRAAVLLVPFVDVINTMLDPTLPLTVGEYLEWGDPRIEEQYRWMRQYDPYSCIDPKEYPAMLVRTALNDTQVMYWEAAKYVARLRAKKIDDNPLLLKIETGAGHSGASGRYDRLKEEAFDYAFVLASLGIGGTKKAGP
jgi:oligopeptidase B